VTTEFNPGSWFHPYHCRDCGSDVGFRSRRRTLSERYLLPLFLMQPVRCGECFRRDYRLIFTQVKDRLAAATGKLPTISEPGAPKRNIA